ncbi:MAG: large subunit ribosomal protein L17 [Candidatus Saganbacteria bacterium]|uniref:50S ribosomal protein L17 n=1 Tax=Candidatus Saganbacteria bacterium TaxID=2575572 RepID=A0A833L142_UNCSA|nr:MAG: large subunit ribosomal protein L17 [Candidatus Saganbacteria bacterium]
MRHKLGIKKLSKPTDQRVALINSIIYSLIKHGKIKLTVTRAKAAKPVAEKLLSLAKAGDIFSRRKAGKILKDRDMIKTLFSYAPRLEGRPGGFTRITKIGYRRGDAAPLGLLEIL